MPDDGLTPELRAELSAIVADLETRGALFDNAGKPIIRWRDIGGLGLVTPMNARDDMLTINISAGASITWTDLDGSNLYADIVKLYRRMERAEAERTVPYGDPSTWRVVEASAGTLPDEYAMAVVSPTGPECWNGCKHTHMVLLREPNKPHAEQMKQAEVCRRTNVRLWRRWMVVMPDGGIVRCFTRWGANRKARKA